MVHHYEYSTINSHHKVLINLQASNMDALKSKSCRIVATELHGNIIADF